MQTSDADLIGTVIDRFRVIRALGTGTMGSVYEAEHTETGVRVALKVLHPHHQGSEAAARFLREGKTLGLFRHRNIVELLEVGRGDDDGSLFLATELVRGVSLRELLKDGFVEPRRALTILRQVLDALGSAHALGVVHRDVKPENIMLADGGSEDGTDLVKVLDFGVAKLLGDTAQILGEANLTQVGLSVFGSPDYIAPETALGKPIDGRADLYSIGAVLYEALAGKPPFDASEPQELLRLAITAPVPPLHQRAPDRTFTPQLEFLVSEALAKNPDQRFRSAAEMMSALDAALLSLDSPSMVLAALSPSPSLSIPVAAVTPPSSSPPSPPAPPAPPAPPSPPSPPLAVAPRLPATPSLPATRPVVQSGDLFPPAKRRKGPDVQRLLAWARAHRMVLAAGAGTLVVVGVLAFALGGDDEKAAASGGNGDGASYLSLGHERFASGRRADALGAYERAIALSPKLADDAELRGNAQKILDGKDAVASVIALELLASRVKPPAYDTIVTVASTGKLADVRRRALAIAERDGFAERVDRVESASLDLQQATTCEDRRAAIEKLADANDKRAVVALKRARSIKCVEKDAADAIARLEAGT